MRRLVPLVTQRRAYLTTPVTPTVEAEALWDLFSNQRYR
jgi:hypothetical protein